MRAEAPTSARPGDKAIVLADGRLIGWVGGACTEPLVRREALRALEDGQPRMASLVGGVSEVSSCPSGGSMDIFIEPRLPQPLLLVFGFSPAARTLVQLAALTGFRTCAVHPGARREDFPGADLVLADLDLAPAGIAPGSVAVVASMGHYDEEAIEACLAHPTLEIALVASARRAAAVRAGLAARGVAAASIDRVRTPTGRRRGVTQEEIALFTLADIVAARHRRPVRHPEERAVAERLFTTDPVCGMTVELPARIATTRGGTTYGFCCEGCRAAFLADPERFTGAVGAPS